MSIWLIILIMVTTNFGRSSWWPFAATSVEDRKDGSRLAGTAKKVAATVDGQEGNSAKGKDLGTSTRDNT